MSSELTDSFESLRQHIVLRRQIGVLKQSLDELDPSDKHVAPRWQTYGGFEFSTKVPYDPVAYIS